MRKLKRQIRKSVFETNSSSSHTIIMAMKSDWDEFERGELYYCRYGSFGFDNGYEPIEGKFYPKDEVIEFLKHYKYEDYVDGAEDDKYKLQEAGFWLYEFIEDGDAEVFFEELETPSGEVVETCVIYEYD